MKNSKKKYSGNKVLNIFAIIFEVIFSLIVIVNTFQMLWCGIGGIGHLINDGGIDNYTKNYIFDDSILENEDVPIGYRDLTNEDMYIIKEYDVSNGEIVIYYWTKIISREILYICLILVCELIRRFLANDNLKNPYIRILYT